MKKLIVLMGMVLICREINLMPESYKTKEGCLFNSENCHWSDELGRPIAYKPERGMRCEEEKQEPELTPFGLMKTYKVNE